MEVTILCSHVCTAAQIGVFRRHLFLCIVPLGLTKLLLLGINPFLDAQLVIYCLHSVHLVFLLNREVIVSINLTL